MYVGSTDELVQVTRWLEESGATNIQTDGHSISFRSTIGNANKMLNTDFQVYKRDGEMKIRTTVSVLTE